MTLGRPLLLLAYPLEARNNIFRTYSTLALKRINSAAALSTLMRCWVSGSRKGKFNGKYCSDCLAHFGHEKIRLRSTTLQFHRSTKWDNDLRNDFSQLSGETKIFIEFFEKNVVCNTMYLVTLGLRVSSDNFHDYRQKKHLWIDCVNNYFVTRCSIVKRAKRVR